MRTHTYSGIFFTVLVATLLFVATGIAAPAEKTTFEGTETQTGIVSIGTWFCPGHEPTGGFPPCPPGSKMFVRGLVFTAFEDLGGFGTAEIQLVQNSNWDADVTGPMWGTFSTELMPAGSAPTICEGTWNGRREMSEPGTTWVSFSRGVGHCRGGEYDGAQIKMTAAITTYEPIPPGYTGTVKGRLLDPEDE